MPSFQIYKKDTNLELYINVAKNGQFCVFLWQEANSAANGEFRSAV